MPSGPSPCSCSPWRWPAATTARPASTAAPRCCTASGAEIPGADLVVEGGKIAAVGPTGEVAVPDGAEVVDLAGKVVIPGLVDTHSHIGIYPRPSIEAHSDGNEMTGAVAAGASARSTPSGPATPASRMARSGGVTTANIMPGSGNAIGGQTALRQAPRRPHHRRDDGHPRRADRRPQDGQRREPQALLRLPGPGPRHAHAPRRPAARAIPQGAGLSTKWDDYRSEGRRQRRCHAPRPRPGSGAAGRGARRQAHGPLPLAPRRRHPDRRCGWREEFGFELVLQHGTEAYKVADDRSPSAACPSRSPWSTAPAARPRSVELREDAPRDCWSAPGCKVPINTDDPITESRLLLRTAAPPCAAG